MDHGRAAAFSRGLLLAGLLAVSAGCGTIITFSDGFEETSSTVSPKPFGGTRLDARGVSVFWSEPFPWPLLSIAFALDLPLSVAADLVTLPITIPLHLTRPQATPTPGDVPEPPEPGKPPGPEEPGEPGLFDGTPPSPGSPLRPESRPGSSA
jgi:hypothetical protein